MKTLVTLVHPDINESRIHSRWSRAIREGSTDGVTLHDLYGNYRDRSIDIAHEQQLIVAHERIIFQFPIYWYSSPPLLKTWFDEVLEYGWAYGHGGHALQGKEFGIAISTWTAERDYRHDGSVGHTIEELTWPFAATFHRVGGRFLPPFVLNDVGNVSDEELDRSALAYVDYLRSRADNPDV